MKTLVITQLLCLALILPGCSSTPEVADAKDRDVDAIFVDNDSRSTPKWRADAVTHYLRGEYPKAIQLFEAANLLEGTTEESRSQYLLFYSYLATGDFTRARETAEVTVRTFPHQSLSYLQLGLAELWSGDDAKALDHFTKAREFDAHPPRLFFYSGLAAGRLKGMAARDAQFERGRTEYNQILKSNPEDFTANFELASLLLYWNKEIDRVQTLISRAKSSLPEADAGDIAKESRLYAIHYLPVLEGILLHRSGETAASNQKLAGALASAPSGARPDIAEILYYMGQNYLKMGNRSQAVELLGSGIKMDPHGPFSASAEKTIREIAVPGNTSP